MENLEQYPPTVTEYVGFQQAFNHFNAELFADCTLPEVLITLRASGRSRGFFCAGAFVAREGKDEAHEIALNVDTFAGRTDAEILSTLVHEMVHLWQREHGKPPRGCYHDKQWSAKMKDVGLYPSSTAEPGGKETGQKCSHYIIVGGRFDVACKKLMEGGYKLHWQSPVLTEVIAAVKATKRASKTKYTCPECDANAWAKPEAKLICGECEMPMEAAA